MKDAMYKPGTWIGLFFINTILFFLTAWSIKSHQAYVRIIDQILTKLSRGYINDFKTSCALVITHLGDYHFCLTMTVIISIILFFLRQYFSSITFLVGFIGARYCRTALKYMLYRPRPNNIHLAPASDGSFPSGHMIYSVFFYGALLFFLIHILIKNGKQSKSWLGMAPALLLVILIGWSRVYLGVHYPTDIIGGIFIGAAWLSLVLSFYIFVKTYQK
ncbi:undecaprenyl-diphosphatase [Scopulibacillus daqui]|uniref:Undecaprenyl-diphosphatase n=1 Tax=Scopulibacillus daqui TaxID=1469162 RepID=A0ABS2Q3P7_9BACL|nr:phosphatase PAP2 family protein [Scopulibacillus daqui]MBM7646309.1 undecaprenyl-diphosphatase [Scopulibacillus daqui]